MRTVTLHVYAILKFYAFSNDNSLLLKKSVDDGNSAYGRQLTFPTLSTIKNRSTHLTSTTPQSIIILPQSRPHPCLRFSPTNFRPFSALFPGLDPLL